MASTGCAAGVGPSTDRIAPNGVRDGHGTAVTPSPASGRTREWEDLARAVMSALGLAPESTDLAIVAADHGTDGSSPSAGPVLIVVARPPHQPGPSEQPPQPKSAAQSPGKAPDKLPDRLPDMLRLLTERERQVASLAGMGKTNRQIAHQMFLSRHTVNFHLRHVYRKLRIRSRVELALLLRP